jgi:hypothetical protein
MADQGKTVVVNDSALKTGAKLVLVLQAVLLLAAIVFYKERCLFIDTPHGLFNMINDNAFQVGESRYGSYLSQLLPFIALQLHAPLWGIMVLFSASCYLLFIVVTLLLIYKYKNYSLAILFGLYTVLFVSDTFYYPPSEGIALLVMALGMVLFMAAEKQSFLIVLPVFICLFYLAIWTHPLVMLAAIYLWFFLWLRGADWPFKPWQAIIFTVVLLCLAYRKYYVGVHHGYDSTRLENVAGISLQKITGIFNTRQFHFFMRSCLTNYWPATILFIAGIVALARQRKYLLLIYFFGFVTAYVVLLSITYPGTTAQYRFYLEFEYMPLAIICVAPFVYYVLPRLNSRQVVMILAIIFSVRLVYIQRSAHFFTDRVTLINSINEKMKQKSLTKIIIPDPGGKTDSIFLMTWATPVESFMLSKLNGEEPQRTFIFADAEQVKSYPNRYKDTLIGCWHYWPSAKLNTQYFRMDTTVPYTLITYPELMK